MSDRQDFINSINKTRNELGLNPYPPGELENKTLEELIRIWSKHLRMKEEQIRKPEEEKRMKENIEKEPKPKNKSSVLKIGAVGVIIIAGVLAFLFYPVFLGTGNSNRIEDRNSKSLENKLKYDTTYSFNSNLDKVVFTLKNEGSKKIKRMNIKLDDKSVEFETINGSLPISKGESIIFTLPAEICEKPHSIIVNISNKIDKLNPGPFICEESRE